MTRTKTNIENGKKHAEQRSRHYTLMYIIMFTFILIHILLRREYI